MHMSERERFEAWARTQGTLEQGWWFRQLDDGGYSAHMPDIAWRGWQAALDASAQPAPGQGQAVEMSPEFTDTSRAALLWVLYHHQGGSSPVGQPIRFALGMGDHEPLSEYQVREARRWAGLTKSTTSDFHRALAASPAPQPAQPKAYYDPENDRVVTASQMHSMLNHQGAAGKKAATTYTQPLASPQPEGVTDAQRLNAVLLAALQRLLASDPGGAIATASEDALTDAANDMDADPVVREQAASILQARAAIRQAQEGGA